MVLLGYVLVLSVHLYYEFSDTILPVEVGINRLYKICMDQTIYLAGESIARAVS
jgi:hypothetical protein